MYKSSLQVLRVPFVARDAASARRTPARAGDATVGRQHFVDGGVRLSYCWLLAALEVRVVEGL